MEIVKLQERIGKYAQEKGWWDDYDAVTRAAGEDAFRLQAALIAEKLALVHSEVSEALEELRNCKSMNDLMLCGFDTDKDMKPVGFATELADVHIRLLDLEEKLGIDVEFVLDQKQRYNETRERKHGNKLL